MRKALSAPELEFFQSTYLFSPFGVDLINHPHTALQGYISATALGGMSVIAGGEPLHHRLGVPERGVRLRAGVRHRATSGVALLAGVAFGGSPYVAAHLLGHFDLLTAWVIPLFALCLRRSLRTGSIAAAVGCGLCVAVAAYAAYYHVVYLALFAVTYTLASWHVVRLHREPRAQYAAALHGAPRHHGFDGARSVSHRRDCGVRRRRHLPRRYRDLGAKRPESAALSLAARIRVAADEMAGRASLSAPCVGVVLARRAGADDYRRDVCARQPAAHRAGVPAGAVGPVCEPDVLLAKRAARCRRARAARRQSVSSAVRAARERVLRTISVSIASKRWAGSASCPSWCC